MRYLLVCTLAAAVAGRVAFSDSEELEFLNGDELDSFVADQATGPEGLDEFKTAVRAKLGSWQAQPAPGTPTQEPPKSSPCDAASQCCGCVHGVAWEIMGRVIDGTRKMCAETKCLHMQKACQMAGKHPLVAFGYLAYETRPISLGFAFCLGEGACPFPEENPLDVSVDFSFIRPKQGFTTGMYAEPSNERLAYSAEKQEASGPESSDTPEAPTDTFHKCMKKSIRAVMKFAVKKTIDFCKTTDDEKASKMCGMAKAHKKVALGVLIAAVEPWKFALGHCYPYLPAPSAPATPQEL